ncbi:hypothetical protein [Catenuloplanes indicus]|uniref:MobA-like NTP transferase domain-containing protein n=1 Tax=Catenuloplanes indicus TaxID=137267 RepID=A0AAE3W2F7_9ACTN|nr:hypothetical protein [Catenuloplanes indicus]MDQ0368141.1 hypothetical protein [Catenuloplanes indicus]
MRVIIAASDGDDPKWANHLGVPKQLAPLDGAPLLAHTIGQARSISDDVHVTLPDDPRYDVLSALPGITRHVRAGDYPSEYASTRDLWATDDRTVLLLGDVYFSAEAIRTIAGAGEHGIRIFGREGASAYTGSDWGAVFATSFWPEHHAELDRHLTEVHYEHSVGHCLRPPGWMLLCAVQGTPWEVHTVQAPWFVEIDDLTDCIDRAVDYARHPVFDFHRPEAAVTPSFTAPRGS